MPLWKIAWRSIQRRRLASSLTAFSMALGVMLVVGVLVIHGLVEDSFRNKSDIGFNLLFGANKGGKLQLVLNTLFHLSEPAENIHDYDFYLDFMDAEYRGTESKNTVLVGNLRDLDPQSSDKSSKFSAHLTGGGTAEAHVQFQRIPIDTGFDESLKVVVANATPEDVFHVEIDGVVVEKGLKIDEGGSGQIRLTSADGTLPFNFPGDKIRADTKVRLLAHGKWFEYVSYAVPVCLGDFYREFRCVGTTPKMFDLEVDGKPRYQFSEGRNFQTWSKEYGFFESVVGARVARKYDLKVGDWIKPTHGSAEGEEHDKFFIVGVLKPTGTPNDRAVFVNMEGFFLLDGHAKPLDEKPNDDADKAIEETPVPDTSSNKGTENDSVKSESNSDDSAREDAEDSKNREDQAPKYLRKRTPLPFAQRELTSLLVQTINPFVIPGLENKINEGSKAQAVMPVKEITSLFNSIVSPIQYALLAMTAMICLVSGIGILVSIYNSMTDRHREIAIMRSLGAGRRTVMMVILLEAVILAVGGGALGWLGGHVAIASASPIIESQTGVQVGLLDFAPAWPSVRYSSPIMKLEKLTNETGKNILDVLCSPELFLIPTIILLAIMVGILPALTAYKTDVAKSLSANP